MFAAADLTATSNVVIIKCSSKTSSWKAFFCDSRLVFLIASYLRGSLLLSPSGRWLGPGSVQHSVGGGTGKGLWVNCHRKGGYCQGTAAAWPKERQFHGKNSDQWCCV